MKKRVIALVLAVLMALLCGCGTAKETTVAAPAPAAQAPAEAPAETAEPEAEVIPMAADGVSGLCGNNVFWSFAYEDWLTDNIRGADYALEKVTGGLHGGIVLLLHAVSADNAGALGAIIDRARDMGYTFRSLEEYHADV